MNLPTQFISLKADEHITRTRNCFDAALLLVGSCLFALGLSAQHPRVVIEPADGFSITWDGNNGAFSSPEPGAAAPNNDASFMAGTFAFASSSFLPGGVHDAINVNDGFYGNSSSWIADFAADPPDEDPFIALNFNRTVQITGVAWSRDNGDDLERTPPGPFTDRAVGVYTLQFTRDPFPSVVTSETGNPDTGWATIGTVQYLPGPDDVFFSAYLRHAFDVSLESGTPVAATAFRIKVSDIGTAIDEIEINPPPAPEPPLSSFLMFAAADGFQIGWDGNEGRFSEPADGSGVPQSAARAPGTTVFASSEGGGNRLTSHLTDGLFGDDNAWAPTTDGSDPTPFVGFAFEEPLLLQNVSWGRDNRNLSTGNALGTYTLQFTQTGEVGPQTPETEDPATGWFTVGTVEFRDAGDPFQPHLRHRFQLGDAGGNPIAVTGFRIVLSSDQIVLDEIELNTNLALELELVRIEPGFGFTVTWDGNNGDFYNAASGASAPDNEALASQGSEAFGSSELGFDIHFIHTVNDGLYGNSSSWISNPAESAFFEEFVGIRFNRTVDIESIAWGRDNGNTVDDCCGGTLRDRSQGAYTVQITRVANPGLETFETGDAETGWVTLAVIEYLGTAPPDFEPHLRNRFDVSANGAPIPATGIRIVVGDPSLAIDEIEVNPPLPPTEQPIRVASAIPYQVSWDGNVGMFQDPSPNARAPIHAGLAEQGTVAFASSELDLGVHFTRSVNDGLYGNSSSWIADFINGDPNPFIGLNFNRTVPILSVAWSRDNGNDAERDPPGPFTDRALGVYTLQITRTPNPGPATPDTGSAATGWETVATITYAEGSLPHPHHLRHRFDLSVDGGPVEATGLRLLVSDPNIAIDEIEVNPLENLRIRPNTGFAIRWDGREGDFFTTESPALAPDNIALAINGSTPFASSYLDFGVHFTHHLNDGLYGNSQSWIADFTLPDPDPFAGVIFPELIQIETIAWGRDNGDDTDCCGGQLMDRADGTYTLQVTTVPNPDPFQAETNDPATGWVTIGEVEYRSATPLFSPWLRHRYFVTDDGSPIAATALRIKVSSPQIAIDEIEVNTPAAVEDPISLSLSWMVSDEGLVLTWQGPGVLHTSQSVTGPWVPVENAGSPYSVPSISSGNAYYLLLAP